jgi:beta-galactosidase
MLQRISYFLFIALTLPQFLPAQQNLSLDGQWEIIFDDKNEGREAGWMQAETFARHPDRQAIKVPSAWETIKQDYEGVAFYRHEFAVPADWEGKIIRLQFGAVNYLAEIWLNDAVVGFHEGGFTPFEFRVDEMIKVGERNVLTLRVVGPLFLSDKEIDGMKALETPQWRGGITGGIWQSVQLVATGEIYVKDVFIQPDIQKNQAHYHILLDHTGIEKMSVTVDISIREAFGSEQIRVASAQSLTLHPGENGIQRSFEVADVQYWSPNHPLLYRTEVKVKYGSQTSDSWSTRFGMRELSIKDKDFYLNGERIYIKATFFEGLYPTGIAYPDAEAMARREIQLAKEAGFNLIRPWRRPPAPMWLDLADEMGVLVVGSPTLECMQLPLSTPYLPKRVENEVRQAILRDRNRACVIQWELFNELHRPVLKQMMRPMAMLARDLDPTRLILDESGGWAFGANMYLPYEYEPTKFNDIHNYPGPFINEERYDGFLSVGMTAEEKKAAGLKGRTPGRNVVPDLMSYISELGYGSLPDLTVNNEKFRTEGNPLTPAYRYHERLAREQEALLAESGFSDLYPDMQQFYLDQQYIHGAANKRMIEAVRANPEVDGYCIHALVAGDWILGAGLLDLWRNPKSYAYEATKAANQARILSIRTKPRNIYAGQGSSLEILGINELEGVAGSLELEITSARGRRVFRKRMDRNWESGVSQLWEEKLNTEKWKGSYKVRVRMLAEDGQVLAENGSKIEVLSAKALSVPQSPIAVLDANGNLSDFLTKAGVDFQPFDGATPVGRPVLVSGNEKNLDPAQAGALIEFIQSGGTAVYLEGPTETIKDEQSVFPFQARVHPAQGLWTCMPHMVHEHPIFSGLPANTMMHDEYENVWATHTLRDIVPAGGEDFETVVGVVAFDWFSEDHKLHYSGPGASWWGADVAIIPVGKGKAIVSQLRLVNKLGQDPVADKILFNLIRFAEKG